MIKCCNISPICELSFVGDKFSNLKTAIEFSKVFPSAIVILGGDVALPLAPRTNSEIQGNRVLHAYRLYKARRLDRVRKLLPGPFARPAFQLTSRVLRQHWNELSHYRFLYCAFLILSLMVFVTGRDSASRAKSFLVHRIFAWS